MDLGLNGKVALVTGAGNPRGVGRAIVDALAAEGAHIVATDLDESLLDPDLEMTGLFNGVRQGLSEAVMAAHASGVDAIEVLADLSSPEEVEELVNRARNHFGQVDILVNVSSGSWGANRVSDYDIDAWQRTIEVNLFGVFLTTRFVLPLMEAAGAGCIINVASIAAERSHPALSAYGAAQAGIVQFTRDVATEYGPQGIRANAILPGDLRNDQFTAECKGMASMLGMGVDEVAELSAESIPLKRLGEVGDVARLALFLASDAASFLTGLSIPLTGGKELPFKGH